MSYKFRFDISVFPREFFEDVARIVERKKLHIKIGESALKLIKKFRIEHITGLPFEDTIKLVEDIIDVHIKNVIGRDLFREANGKKALLLPHCSRKYMDMRCKASFDPELSSYTCGQCSDDCLINRATKLAKKRGYEVFVIPGGSCVKKILGRKKFSGVVGVACFEEMKMGGDLVGSMKTPVQGVPLIKNGCANTAFNMETLEMVL